MTDTYAIYCPHMLDMRTNPRCYMCRPLEIECSCPTLWWGVVPPSCPVHNPSPPTITTITAGGVSRQCSCPPNRGDNYSGSCPIHDYTTTYS